MKAILQFIVGCVLAYAAFASIMLAGLLIAPAASVVVFGVEIIAFIKSMDYIYEKKQKAK